MLDYEQSLTRECSVPKSVSSAPDDKAYYNTSAHFIWIGDRTRQIDGGHVEYFRGIRNPIGIKVGPSMQSDELVRLLDSNCMFYLLDHLLTNPCLVVVNPEKIPGRVTLISRYGADKVGFFFDFTYQSFLTLAQIDNHLAEHIKAVKASQHPVIWVCDPMHGK